MGACRPGPVGPLCGNGICEAGETVACADCVMAVCGNGVCDPGETATTCAADCTGGPQCGDGVCDPGETAANCPVDCTVGPACGNGTCGGGETCSSCVADCGMCPASCGNGACDAGETPSTCPADCPCTSHMQCATDEICISGGCDYAYGRVYDVLVVDSVIDSGVCWDAACGAPDPWVNICDTTACLATSVVNDSFTPVWNYSVIVTLTSPSTAGLLTFEVWDEDLTIDDLVFFTPWLSPVDLVNIVRTQGGSYLYTDVNGDLLVMVTP